MRQWSGLQGEGLQRQPNLRLDRFGVARRHVYYSWLAASFLRSNLRSSRFVVTSTIRSVMVRISLMSAELSPNEMEKSPFVISCTRIAYAHRNSARSATSFSSVITGDS